MGKLVPPYDVPMTDPTVTVGSHIDYLYTGAGGYDPPNISVRAFTDLEHLGAEVDAMPALPPWTTGWTSAPDVRHVDGRYVMWFSSPDVDDILATGVPAKCIGVGVSTSPFGPFIVARQPVICDPSGSIDPRTFVAPDGQLWLDWKADVNAAWGPAQDPDLPQNQPTVLWAQRLAPDGMTLEGSPHELLAATRLWEHKLIEAPEMVHADGRFYLFFSANPSYQDGDGIGVAVCRGPAGPCEEPYAGPILGSSPLGLGPGEESLFSQGGVTWMLFSPSGTALYRQLAVARIAFGPHGPYVSAFDGAIPGLPRPARAPSLFELPMTREGSGFEPSAAHPRNASAEAALLPSRVDHSDGSSPPKSDPARCPRTPVRGGLVAFPPSRGPRTSRASAVQSCQARDQAARDNGPCSCPAG